ncbi:hypothetical protein LNP27_10515 [Flavobacterium galactosidilyticum]|uniref:hypothetical protein n=1 Tax=Flavobacterium galactosidilyticum TaxID=2893886 RepID=UPI001E2ECF18|nr:hypothetical protein [Flavobacterium sp. F-340]UFH45565.1 hypothetical protein LNP27_10515 [Flavobacterium sp. F-340]
MVIHYNTRIRRLLLTMLTIISFASFTSCSQKIAFQNSTVVPAAQGIVTIKKDNNKNYAIKIKISNLAEVQRLQPAKNVYVVWIETEENRIKNIGQIKSNTGFISSKLKASFETVTSFQPTKVFITAEENQDVIYPGYQMVLTTNKF